MKFRKKPVVVEAMQWDATVPTGERLREWSDHRVRHHGGSICFIETLEGTMEARPGDWIIRGVKGEFYPCKPDIFEATYEPEPA
jgi:hypothetical protein